MFDLEKALDEAEALYPALPVWAKKVMGYADYPSLGNVRVFLKFLKFVEGFEAGNKAVGQKGSE